MIINAGNLHTMTVGFKTLFNQAFVATESHTEKLATLMPSIGSEDNHCWIGSAPTMREWVGDRVINNPEAFSYTIKNRTFESTIAVSREDIEDDKYGAYSPLVQQFGVLAKTHPDELIFGLMKAGFTGTCFDGQYFFDADHPVKGGVASNMQAGGEPAWFLLDTSKLVKPFIFQKRRDYALTSLTRNEDENVFMRKEYIYGVDARVNAGYGLWQFAFGSKATLSEANYAAARATMRSFKAANGSPLHVTPSVLVVGPSLEDAARKLLLAQQNSTGASNVYANTADLIVSAWLD